MQKHTFKDDEIFDYASSDATKSTIDPKIWNFS